MQMGAAMLFFLVNVWLEQLEVNAPDYQQDVTSEQHMKTTEKSMCLTCTKKVTQSGFSIQCEK